jgi:hypothetical protein
MCNGLYLGSAQGVARTYDFWANPAIDPGASNDLDPNFMQTIQVTVGNQATYQVPSTLDLYWSDPTTGFHADPARMIGTDTPLCPPHNSLTGTDSQTVVAYSWLPGATAAGTNGGHVCLLALTSHNPAPVPGGGDCGGGYPDAAAPTTDFRTAIHNIQLVVGGAHRKSLHFGFAATNPFRVEVGTKLCVRPLTPEHHAQEFERLLAPQRNYAFVECGTRFGNPSHIGLVLGPERILAQPYKTVFADKGDERYHRHPLLRSPRLGFTGPLTNEVEVMLRGPNQRYEECLHFDLLPFEVRQAIVTVEPSEGPDLFAFQVIHETTEPKPRLLGGINFIYKVRKRLY